MLGSGSGDLLEGVTKVAVLRANVLGDFVLTLPALEALRAAYPDAELVLLGTPMHVELLADRPSPVDRVVVVPVSRGVREEPGAVADPGELDAFVEGMRADAFDVALQLHGGGRWSNPFLRRLGARTTVGARAADAPPLDRTLPYALHQHEALRLLELVGLIGAGPVTVTPTLAVTPADRWAADRLLGPGGAPLVVLHPGARDPGRRWPPAAFAEVASTVARLGARVVVTGTAAERAVAEEVAGSARCPVEVAAGSLSLRELVGVLDRAAVVVSNDTGPRHLAEAVGTATVSVFLAANVLTAGPLSRGRHRVHVSWRPACPVCGSTGLRELYPLRDEGEPCGHRESLVADVPVEEVVPDVLELFAAERPDR